MWRVQPWYTQKKKKKAKISWNDICFPKKEGGLGLKDVEILNISFMMRHIWSIFAKSGSI
jgi:hypothetical protein